ncbi:MAG TPA: hypothetical protein PKV19_04745, partial [Anaerolineales bacterium]|nr:hypothetical protein [Anaerolineales bacterium]
ILSFVGVALHIFIDKPAQGLNFQIVFFGVLQACSDKQAAKASALKWRWNTRMCENNAIIL